jgi:hypothetical protein
MDVGKMGRAHETGCAAQRRGLEDSLCPEIYNMWMGDCIADWEDVVRICRGAHYRVLTPHFSRLASFSNCPILTPAFQTASGNWRLKTGAFFEGVKNG